VLERSEHLLAQVAREVQEETKKKANISRIALKIASFLAKGVASVVPGDSTLSTLTNAIETEANVKDRIEEIASVASTRSAFEDLIANLLDTDTKDTHSHPRLIVLIDDVDRALPDQIMTMLKNLKLILEVDRCVFLLGMDMVIVAHAIENFYKTRTTSVSLSSPNVSVAVETESTDSGAVKPCVLSAPLRQTVQTASPPPNCTGYLAGITTTEPCALLASGGFLLRADKVAWF
jgi:KAP family P-loop domain